MKLPSIILINCDDLGYGDLGCYGSKVNSTPALDRIASEGVRFTDFYMASSICSPSRAGMLTGCYPQRISLTHVLFPCNADGLNPEEVTIAQILKDQGYNTKIVGKWHCGDQPEFLPLNFGFDSYYGLPYSNDMGRQTGDKDDRPPLPLIRDNEVIEEQPDQSGLTERYVEESVRFIRDSVKEEKPFFLYFAHMYVHVPLFVPDYFVAKSRNGRYGGAVACIDWAWGVLDRELEKLGIKEDTIIIFTSDNGSRAKDDGNNHGCGSNEPLRGSKFTTWEGGFRLPCLMRWPGKIAAGSEISEIASSIDFLPTLTSIAGGNLPEKTIDGKDLSLLILGKTAESPRTEFAYFADRNLAAVRWGKWKLHLCRRPEEWSKPYNPVQELYDLENDIGEENNVFNDHPKVVASFNALICEFRSKLGDKFTGNEGFEVRDCGWVDDPRPLTVYNEEHPYIIAEYDLAERG
ncbi:MAG: sulfatase [Candidatus Lindowbacteria bacterium]|nr:sulfatase [Candidatus Lindowbacteria bacterium]